MQLIAQDRISSGKNLYYSRHHRLLQKWLK